LANSSITHGTGLQLLCTSRGEKVNLLFSAIGVMNVGWD
jgi:hypothetical protein